MARALDASWGKSGQLGLRLPWACAFGLMALFCSRPSFELRVKGMFALFLMCSGEVEGLALMVVLASPFNSGIDLNSKLSTPKPPKPVVLEGYLDSSFKPIISH